MRKNIISILLVLTMCIGLLPAMAFASSYSDTEGHWADSSINRWSEYGIVQGSNGQFSPNSNMTRAQAATVFSKLLCLEETADISAFSDISENAWYAEAIAKCVAAGIMNSVNDTQMKPAGTITREMFFVMFARAMKIDEETELKPEYSDANQLSSWAKGSVFALINNGYVNGLTDTTIGGKNNINRASVMALLDKAISEYSVEDGKPVITLTKNLIIYDSSTVSGGTYDNVTIAASVGNGDVTLNNIVVKGKLTVRGGGSNSIHLNDCQINQVETNKVVGGYLENVKIEDPFMDPGNNLEYNSKFEAEEPRIVLNKSSVDIVDVSKPAILEADSKSTLQTVNADANLIIQGEQTRISTLNINKIDNSISIIGDKSGSSIDSVNIKSTNPTEDGSYKFESLNINKLNIEENSKGNALETHHFVDSDLGAVILALHSGSINTADVSTGANITGSDSTIKNINVNAPLSVDSAIVNNITIQAPVEVKISGTSATSVEIDSSKYPEAVSTQAPTLVVDKGNNINISSKNDSDSSVNVVEDGKQTTKKAGHEHSWDSGRVTTEPTYTTEGIRTYRCTKCGKEKTESIARIPQPVISDPGLVEMPGDPTPEMS